MTKIYRILALILISLVPIGTGVYAAEPTTNPIKIPTSEYIMGGNCKCDIPGGETYQEVVGPCPSTTPVAKRRYMCESTSGLAGFEKMLASIIKWFVNIVMLLGVLAIVGLGIAWSLAGGDDAKAKSGLKKWAINILVGMIILFFFRYILQFLAPWIYK